MHHVGMMYIQAFSTSQHQNVGILKATQQTVYLLVTLNILAIDTCSLLTLVL